MWQSLLLLGFACVISGAGRTLDGWGVSPRVVDASERKGFGRDVLVFAFPHREPSASAGLARATSIRHSLCLAAATLRRAAFLLFSCQRDTTS